MTNPYAPPQATVLDITDPAEGIVPAERGTRLGAAIVDSILFILIVYLPAVFAGITGASGGGGVFMWVGLTGIGFIAWSWITIKGVRRNGQSIAKKLFGIKVIRSNGTPVSLGRVFWLRNVINGILSFIPLYGVVELLFIFAESRQCLHDKIADTIVVKA